MPKRPASSVPSPDYDVDWDSWLRPPPSTSAHEPLLPDTAQGFAGPPPPTQYPPYHSTTMHSTAMHSYPHAADDYCTGCNIWPTALPSFGNVAPSPAPFHPGAREYGAPGPHVFDPQPQYPGSGHEWR
ncbi:hypothetical protein JCM3775_003025 [Rhodotorula graminis]